MNYTRFAIFLEILLSLSIGGDIVGQNLVRNGDFEELLIDTLYDDLFTVRSFDKKIKYWKNFFKFTSPVIINNKIPVRPYNYHFTYEAPFITPYKNNTLIVLAERAQRNRIYDSISQEYTYADTIQFKTFKNGFSKIQTFHNGFYQELKNSLIPSQHYRLSYRCKMGFDRGIDTFIDGQIRSYRNVMSGFGIKFSLSDSLAEKYPYGPTELIPHDSYLQDTVFDTSYKWRLVERAFIADSAYKYIYFNRFANIKESKYYLYDIAYSYTFINQIDDIRLLPIDQYLQVSRDTSMCIGDSVELRVIAGEGPYSWRTHRGDGTILSSDTTLNCNS